MNNFKLDRFKDKIIGSLYISPRDAAFSDFPEELNKEIVDYLKSQGIDRLYRHQAD